MNKRLVLGLILALFVLSACAAPVPQSGQGLKVLASTTFLADIAQNVAGERAQVASLLPYGADPHAYQPVPSDARRVADSAVLIVNGLEYEHFLETLLENAGGERLTVVASAGLTPRQAPQEEQAGGEEHAHEAGDPHMWLDPHLVVRYVENIRDGLIQADPQGEAEYRANAEAYIARLKELDAWIAAQVGQIPPQRRLLATNHESLGYFAERYGFETTGSVLSSFSSNAAPSAQQMAQLIDDMKRLGVSAIFLDAGDNETLAQQIAAETGARVVSDLHLESLTEGAPAPTYLEMMRHNVSRIVEALK